MTDHDRLFKELLTTFFLDFIELFFPDILTYLDPTSLSFIDKELFTDVTAGERYETDILVQAQFKNQPTCFLIHLENQATPQSHFGKRMFRYFARLYEKYDAPIYPIVIFSYDKPRKRAPKQFRIELPDFTINTFNYRVLQLNQLSWRDFLDQPNPIASALMAKMRISSKDRPKVKAQCLRLLVTLKLDPARMHLISGFIDTYLRLNNQEQHQFQKELGNIEPEAQEATMQIVTSWMEEGIEQGLQQGLQQGKERETNLVLKQLQRYLGHLPEFVVSFVRQLDVKHIEALGEAFLDFGSIDDLVTWLILSPPSKQRSAAAIHLLKGHLGEISPASQQKIETLTRKHLKQLGRSLLKFDQADDLETWLHQSISSSSAARGAGAG